MIIMMKMNQIKLLYDSDDFLLYLPKNKNCMLRSVKTIYLKNIQEKEKEKIGENVLRFFLV